MVLLQKTCKFKQLTALEMTGCLDERVERLSQNLMEHFCRPIVCDGAKITSLDDENNDIKVIRPFVFITSVSRSILCWKNF